MSKVEYELSISWVKKITIIIFFQDKVNFYASELNITRMNREKQRKSNFDHLFKIQAFGDYDYHHNFFEGAVNRNMKFWDKELIQNYTKAM